MNIALIGYGKMGKTIEKVTLERGHTIAAIIDSSDFNINELDKSDEDPATRRSCDGPLYVCAIGIPCRVVG